MNHSGMPMGTCHMASVDAVGALMFFKRRPAPILCSFSVAERERGRVMMGRNEE